MIFNFDYEAMKKRISEISLKNFSVLNELEKAFLFYHLRKSIQAFEVLKIASKQAFREGNYGVWYISLYNMYNMPLSYDRFGREQLKYLRDIGTTLDTNLIEAYQMIKKWKGYKLTIKKEYQ